MVIEDDQTRDIMYRVADAYDTLADSTAERRQSITDVMILQRGRRSRNRTTKFGFSLCG